MSTNTKTSLVGKLPMQLPRFSCPICGSVVHMMHIGEWGTDDGEIIQVDFECETEPDIDSDEWHEWFAGHYAMPYVEWLPWENKVMKWLNENYDYRA